MTLQQLRYFVAVAECGNLTHAAQRMYVAQPSVSKAISDLESEMGLSFFTRSVQGMALTDDGSMFLSRARRVLEEAASIERDYKGGDLPRRVFSVSSQHYSFVVNAFVRLLESYPGETYEFHLREEQTWNIIEDVRTGRSEIGVLYFGRTNKPTLRRLLEQADLVFEPLFTARAHVFLSRANPLSRRKSVSLSDLRPYPRLVFDQGVHNEAAMSEELHADDSAPKTIVVTDRATLFNLLIGFNCYTISSGVVSSDLNGEEIVSVPLESPENMTIGIVRSHRISLVGLAADYIEHLKSAMRDWAAEAVV